MDDSCVNIHNRGIELKESSLNVDDSCELESLRNVPDLESPNSRVPRSFSYNQRFHNMNVLEILRETIRILRYNASSFMVIAAILICPLSAVVLSNVLVDQSTLKELTVRLLLAARAAGIPLVPFVKQSCRRLSEMIISSFFGFPLYITLSLLSKVAVVYSVDCSYSRKKPYAAKFFSVVGKIWKRLVLTYVWVCMAIACCLLLFLVLIGVVCNVFTLLGFNPSLVVYPAVMVGFAFSIIFANAIIICNLAIVISVLEDVSGVQALVRSGVLIRGQTQVGLLIFLGSTIGMAFVEGLFEHRVKTLSYGDGSSRIWEGPLLVVMYSFVVLIDSMMSAVFYFTCRFSSTMEVLEGDDHGSEEEEEEMVPSSSSLDIR
ncbi:hypothetical protein Syun_023456 [Stephania yunnanensis]|uniref:Uncharacterized protein n=1 Tax=Stephania yunnanensis TaxID=152371 RepID=A0AAP0I3G7_9MAGN